ncbi:Transmembrane transporter [Exophiala dermatitidis]
MSIQCSRSESVRSSSNVHEKLGLDSSLAEKAGGVDSIDSVGGGDIVNDLDNGVEIFKVGSDLVDFRTVGWQFAAIIFIKVQFATGVMSLPYALYELGAVGGAFSLVVWGAVNTYVGKVQGDFRNAHAGCHSIADMAQILGGPILREIIGVLFMIAFMLAAGSGILGVTVGLNALSGHAICTVWWSFIATIVVAAIACTRKFEKMSWLTLVGFISIFIAVFIVVVGVTTLDRPAAAPQTGPYDLGYHAIGNPTFLASMVATSTIFVSSAATAAYLPVMSEMKSPKDYNKALYTAMGFVTAAYLSFSLVVYRWCGRWVATPSLGSAGPVVKKVAYGVALIGLFISAALYLHVAAKYVFVRILRNSRHLQGNTLIHWGTWLACVCCLSAISFILVSAIPIFNYLIAMVGSIAYAPIALIFPGWLWLYDHSDWWKRSIRHQAAYSFHWLLILAGSLVCIAGTYAVIKEIVNAYATGVIGQSH